MQRLASILTLAALLTVASVEARTKPEAPVLPGSYGAYQVVSDAGAAAASNSSSNDKTVELVPAYFVADPLTAGKKYKSNACDTCSLCLSRTGGMSNKLTSDSVYRQGTYEVVIKEAAIEKCLKSRSCQACEVKSKTVTFPATTVNGEGYASIPPLFRNTDFPAGSYLLDMKADATLTAGVPFFSNETYIEGSYIVDYGYVFATPNTNPPVAFASTFFGSSAFYTNLQPTSGICRETETFPVSCTQDTASTLCNRCPSVFSFSFSSGHYHVNLIQITPHPPLSQNKKHIKPHRYTLAVTKDYSPLDQLTPETWSYFATAFQLPQAPTFCFPGKVTTMHLRGQIR